MPVAADKLIEPAEVEVPITTEEEAQRSIRAMLVSAWLLPARSPLRPPPTGQPRPAWRLHLGIPPSQAAAAAREVGGKAPPLLSRRRTPTLTLTLAGGRRLPGFRAVLKQQERRRGAAGPQPAPRESGQHGAPRRRGHGGTGWLRTCRRRRWRCCPVHQKVEEWQEETAAGGKVSRLGGGGGEGSGGTGGSGEAGGEGGEGGEEGGGGVGGGGEGGGPCLPSHSFSVTWLHCLA